MIDPLLDARRGSPRRGLLLSCLVLWLGYSCSTSDEWRATAWAALCTAALLALCVPSLVLEISLVQLETPDEDLCFCELPLLFFWHFAFGMDEDDVDVLVRDCDDLEELCLLRRERSPFLVRLCFEWE